MRRLPLLVLTRLYMIWRHTWRLFGKLSLTPPGKGASSDGSGGGEGGGDARRAAAEVVDSVRREASAATWKRSLY